jgi:hypothetical protein
MDANNDTPAGNGGGARFAETAQPIRSERASVDRAIAFLGAHSVTSFAYCEIVKRRAQNVR